MSEKQPLIIGDTPNQLNTRCANWVDVVVVDGTCYDKDSVAKLLAERDALAAQLDVLRTAALNAISFMSGGTAKAKLRDAYDATPQQCLRDVQASAINSVTLDCYDAGLLNDFGGGNVAWWQDYMRSELNAAHDFYEDQISQCADAVRQGGAA